MTYQLQRGPRFVCSICGAPANPRSLLCAIHLAQTEQRLALVLHDALRTHADRAYLAWIRERDAPRPETSPPRHDAALALFTPTTGA